MLPEPGRSGLPPDFTGVMIVLDKSYLVGAPTRVVRALCAQRTVVFTETLLFELLTTDSDSAAMFRKLPARDNPICLLSNCKALLDYETAHHRPCGPLRQHFITERFGFNPQLSFPGSPLLEANETTVAEWRAAVEQLDGRQRVLSRTLRAPCGLRPSANHGT